MVKLCIIKTGDEVGRTRAAGRKTDAKLAGELGMGDRHEGAHLLVARLDEVNACVPLDGADDAVDPVSGVTEDPGDTPRLEAIDEEVGGVHGFTRCLLFIVQTPDQPSMLRELFATVKRRR